MYQPTEQDLSLLQQRIKNPYIQLIICDQNDIYNQLDVIDSVVINDNYNIDVTSDVRRTYNLTLSVDKTYDILGIQERLWINKIIYIKYGIHNTVTNRIKWYPFGYFTFTDFTYSVTETDYTVQINCIDLVGLYNGTVAGQLSGLNILIPNGESVLQFMQDYKQSHENAPSVPTPSTVEDDTYGKYNISNWISILEGHYNSLNDLDGYYWNDNYLEFKQIYTENNNWVTSLNMFWDNKMKNVLKDVLLQNGIPEDRIIIDIPDEWNINYDLEFNVNTTVWEIISNLQSMYDAQAYFDNNGIFVFEQNTESKDPDLNTALYSEDISNLIISETLQQNTSNIYNVIQIFGQTYESNGGSLNLNDWTFESFNKSYYQLSIIPNYTSNYFNFMLYTDISIPVGQLSIIDNSTNLNTIYQANYFDVYETDKTQLMLKNSNNFLPTNKMYYCHMYAGKKFIIHELSYISNINQAVNTTYNRGSMLEITAKPKYSIPTKQNFCLYANYNTTNYENNYKFVKINNDYCYGGWSDNEATSYYWDIGTNIFSNNYYHFLNLTYNGKKSMFRISNRSQRTNIISNVNMKTINARLYTNTNIVLKQNNLYAINIPNETNSQYLNNPRGVYIKVQNGLYPLMYNSEILTTTNGKPLQFKFTSNGLELIGETQVYSTVILTSNKANRIASDIDKEEEGDFNIQYVELSDYPYTVEKIGKRRHIYNDGHYGNLATSQDAYENCLYELWHNSHITNQITLNNIMIPWLQGNEIVNYRTQKTNQQNYYVIKQVQGSVSTWTQTITMQEFESFDPPYEWYN